MAKDYPSQFGNSEQYRNPDGTNPMPSPENIPRPRWDGPRTPFRWEVQTVVTDEVAPAPPLVNLEDTPLAPGVVYTYTWTSPVFDLRPDLRSSQGAAKAGTPIWSTAARLYIQMLVNSRGSGNQVPLNRAVGLDVPGSIAVTARDWVNTFANVELQTAPSDGVTGGAGLQRGNPTDVSGLFNVPLDSDATTVLAGFAPPGTTLGSGDGYPVRYWRLELTFTCTIETGLPLPDPLPTGKPLVLQPSVY